MTRSIIVEITKKKKENKYYLGGNDHHSFEIETIDYYSNYIIYAQPLKNKCLQFYRTI